MSKPANSEIKKVFKKLKTTKWKIILLVLFVLIAIRIALPYIVLHYANKTLAGMNGYYGHIEDVDISLLRGAYQLDEFYINKIDKPSKKQFPFIASKTVDLSIHWQSLLHGRLVGELDFYNSTMHFARDKVEPSQIQKDTNDFRIILKKFMPLKVNRFEINNGNILFIDSTTKPIVVLSMDRAHVLAENLSSVRDTSLLPANVIANANLYKGKLDLKMKLDPLAMKPTFDMNVTLKNTNLVELNDFFKAYASIDVNKGIFGLYMEMASKEGEFIGYVKPVIKDLDVIGPSDKNDSFFNKIWEGIVSIAGVVLENKKEEQIATRIPIHGKFDNTTVEVWYALVQLLRNAFIQAIYPSIDNKINIKSIDAVKKGKTREFFNKIIKGSDDKKDKNK
jgi:hypothetical protein